MATTQGKKKKSGKKKARAHSPIPRRALMVAGMLLTGGIILGLAFISIELAVITAGFTGIGAFMLADSRRRTYWEQSASFKFIKIFKTQEEIKDDLERNKMDISYLKHTPSSTLRRETHAEQTGPEKDPDIKVKPRPATPPQRAMAPSYEELFDPAPVLRAERPGTKTAAQSSRASEDEEPQYSDMVVKELIHHAVTKEQIEVFAQPIMRLPQRKIRFYEMFARIRARPGVYLPAAHYMKLARDDAAMNAIDNMLLMECIKTIRTSAHIEKAAPFFLNITTDTLKNAAFMKRLVDFLGKNRALAPRLVFEIRQQNLENMPPVILEILRGLGQLGCALSLDHVQTLDFDMKFLQVLNVRFVKIGAEAFLSAAANNQHFTQMIKLKRRLEGNGIGVIVEKIESENDLKEILDFDIHYGQGYLFGRPDLQGAYRQRSAA